VGSFGKKGTNTGKVPHTPVEVDQKVIDERREQLSKTTDYYLLNLEERDPDWFTRTVLKFTEDGLRSLRHYIEGKEDPEISWENPTVELQYPMNYADLFPILTPETLKSEEDTKEAFVNVILATLEYAVLSSATEGMAVEKRGEESRLLVAPWSPHFKDLENLPTAERDEKTVELMAPFSIGGQAVLGPDGEQRSLFPLHPEAFEHDLKGEELPEGYRIVGRSTPPLTFHGAIDSGEEFTAYPSVQFHPLVCNVDEERSYYPVVVGLHFYASEDLPDRKEGEEYPAPSYPDPSTWSKENQEDFWNSLLDYIHKERERLLPEEEEEEDRATPERVVPVKRSVMSPVPMPREAHKFTHGMALQRGLGRMFAGYRNIPDLDIHEDLARQEAEALFWSMLEDFFDKKVKPPVPWERKEVNGKTVLTFSGLPEDKVRTLWYSFTKTLNAGQGGPGVEVAPPSFKERRSLNPKTTEVEHTTTVVLWPEESLTDRNGKPTLPVKFRRKSSPGYLALLDRQGPSPFFADGWVWFTYGEEREGFRIGGLPLLLYPEGQRALERLLSRNIKDLEGELNHILQNPSIFQDEEERAVRGLHSGIERVKRQIKRLKTYDCQDLVLCIFEAFWRQRNTWVEEKLELRNGRKIQTSPWKIIRLDPGDLRLRLDPGGEWGKNWRGCLFDRLEALATFQRRTVTRKGRAVDVGDSLLRRVLDGRRPPASSSPDGDPYLGLVRLLKNAGAFPYDAFFVEVSFDFMGRLYTWATDERGHTFWGIDAAQAVKRLSLASSPSDKKGAEEKAKEKRAKAKKRPHYYHSPRLMTIMNLRNYPHLRKQFAYILLTEKTPNYKTFRDSKGRNLRRRTKNRLGGKEALFSFDGMDFFLCGGKYGTGYKVQEWLRKVGYKRRTGPGGGVQAYRDFLKDLRVLFKDLGLRLKIMGSKSGTALDQEALTTLTTFKSDPPKGYGLKLKVYLPENTEDHLRDLLKEADIDTIDEYGGDILSPSRPGGLTPAQVRVARAKAGWTQGELAEKIGVSQMTISRWENAEKPIPAERDTQLREVLKDYFMSEE